MLYECIHCGRAARDHAHVEGLQKGLQRCYSGDSGLPYGYNAHPVGTMCKNPCRGSYEPDPDAIQCSDHQPRQHRDTRPPWCKNCGLTKDFKKPKGIFDK